MTMVINNEPWFVGKDVAMMLGYVFPRRASYNHVDEEDKTTVLIQHTGSNYKSKTIFINESGLYALILSSKFPQAREFKRRVASEVLGYAILRMLSQGMWMQKIKGAGFTTSGQGRGSTTFVISESGSNYKSKTSFINESGLYALILPSKLPQAREFKRWVTSEVLGQMRKMGGYILINGCIFGSMVL